MNIPYFPFFVNDWLSETAHLSDTECGVLMRVWCQMWRNGERTGDPSLADDDRIIARLLGRSVTGWRKVKEVLTEGENAPLYIQNSRLFSQSVSRAFEKSLSKHLSQSEAARRTNQTLRRSVSDTLSDTVSETPSGSTRTRPEPEPEPEPKVVGTPTSQVSMSGCRNTHISGNAREKNANLDEDGSTAAIAILAPSPPAGTNGRNPDITGFERFWEAYPKQVARGAAYEAWSALRRAGGLPDIEVLIASIEAHKRFEPNWRTERFIPNPAKYLSEHRWLDVFQAQSPITDPLMCALAEGR